MVLKATQKNISDILGTHTKGLKFIKQPLGNGFAIRGFMSRYALEDLLSQFHVYINKNNDVVVITKGRLNMDNHV